MPESPAVSVVVASHARRLRLRWLLNALEQQACEQSWEVIVVHDYDPETARRVIDDHPLTAAGKLSHLAIEPGTGSPSRQRNIGWRAARADLVAFTDDDCRPETGWLAALLAETDGSETTVVQGRTRPDPFERALLSAPHVRTLEIDPVNAYRQTANILYPKALLERLDGFDEVAISGEDVGLSLRAEATGAEIVAAPEAIVNHAVESHTLPGIIRQNLKWRHLAYLVKTHPEFRRELTAGLFWDREHLLVSLALAGLAGSRRDRRALLLAAPYLASSLRRHGHSPVGLALGVAELPGRALRQSAEVAGLAIGSLRHRTAVL